MSQALKRLRSDAAFQDAVDQGLKEATERFVREYTVEDEDLVADIARDPDFWKAESVRKALLDIVRHPGIYLAEERMALAQGFADVLCQRVNRERVDRAVAFYLRCVAEALWHLEPLRPVYELQMQRLSVERATQMVQELRGMRADVQGAMMALVQAIGEQQKLLAAPGRSALPEPKKVYHNLPHPDYGTFIGREKELAQVCTLALEQFTCLGLKSGMQECQELLGCRSDFSCPLTKPIPAPNSLSLNCKRPVALAARSPASTFAGAITAIPLAAST